ncbi:MAG TPA: hypothetical protein VF755_03540 [Catenuloplanes sp.]
MLATTAPAPAQAAPDNLPLKGAADVVATNDRVFVSGGRRSTAIVVTDAAGKLVTTIDGLAGPTDLLLSADGETVFAALHSGGVVLAIDARSLETKARYDVLACASSLAQSGHWLWVGYGCGGSYGNIASIDLRSGAVRANLLPARTVYEAPALSAPAKNLNILLVGEKAISPASLYVYAVSADGSLTEVRENPHGAVGSNLRDVAATADGSAAIVAAGWPYRLQEFRTDDMGAPKRVFETGAYPNAVELSPDERWVAGGSFNWYDPEIFLFERDGTFDSSFRIGGGRATLPEGALAWSPDSRRFYAVAWDERANPPVAPSLHVFTVTADTATS